jgi:hypothetical protein
VSATGNGEDRDEDQENEEDEPPNQVWWSIYSLSVLKLIIISILITVVIPNNAVQNESS